MYPPIFPVVLFGSLPPYVAADIFEKNCSLCITCAIRLWANLWVSQRHDHEVCQVVRTMHRMKWVRVKREMFVLQKKKKERKIALNKALDFASNGWRLAFRLRKVRIAPLDI